VALAKFGEALANKNLYALTMPAYSIPVANVLNGTAAFSASGEAMVKFIAPDARVLVVDDINTNLKVAEGLMLPYRMQVELCNSGAKAIEAVKQAASEKRDFDLVFMDHMMPEMDGIEAASAIRAMEGERFAAMPIIALTANVISGMRELFIIRGFSDLLAKPIDVSKLDEILDRWIPKEKREQAGTENREWGIGSGDHDSNEKFLLPNIAGVDVWHGIAMTGGTLEGYRLVLSIFSEDAEYRLPLLQTVPETDALPEFTTHVHALKSASAAIGAEEISAQAAVLETAGKAGDLELIREKLPAFVERLAELAKNIRNVMGETTPPEPPDLSPFIPSNLLRELEAALNSQDLRSIDNILTALNEKPLDSKTKKIMEQISGHVLMAEYEEAAAIASATAVAILEGMQDS
jgi:CheY-like chemotaxis protein